MSACRSCGQPIRWCFTETGKRLPVDLQPDPRGNLVVAQREDGEWSAQHEANVEATTPDRFVAHFATCPQADGWRRR